MAYRMGEMAVLRASDREKFVTKLRASIVKHAGVLLHAAQDLDVGLTTLKRWVGEEKTLTSLVKVERTKARKGRIAAK